MSAFVSFEGGDGSGKSTLIQRIIKDFQEKRLSFISTREPGGGTVSEEIREIIVKAGRTMNPLTELFLFEAARAEHVANVIKPALASGKHVLCDRYTHSSLAYQGVARGLGLEFVQDLNTAATGGLEPNVVVWLKISPEDAAARIKARGEESRLDAESLAFHQKVFKAFVQLSKDKPEQFIVLDATATPDAVYAQLVADPKWKKLFGAAQ